MKKPPLSLRARLVLIVFTATLAVWIAAGLMSYRTALREVDELLDGQMVQSAKLLMAQIRHEEKELYEAGMVTQVLQEITLPPYEQPVEFQVWNTAGQLLLRSAQAPRIAKAERPGFANVDRGDRAWRVFAIAAKDSHYQVQVAQTLADRQEAAFTVASQSAIPMLLAWPLLGAIVYWGVRRGLGPLDSLAGDMDARDPEHLAPLDERLTPREVRPLIAAINSLMARLDTALNNERRFTADAAHELRTPLAAIKVHTQVALASPDPHDCRHALNQVLAGTDRAGRLVEQLLRLARLDPLHGLDNPRPVDLAQLARKEAEQIRPLADAAGQSLNLASAMASATVSADADMLALALRNLLENAIRYTPAGGAVSLGVDADTGSVRLRLRDNGPGVAAEELPYLAERFYRSGEATPEGSGLGLAIVQRVAELHGARLTLENLPEGGFQASLTFPSARSA